MKSAYEFKSYFCLFSAITDFAVSVLIKYINCSYFKTY